MEKLTRKALAKINLGLDVLGIRPDGYHELRMLMQSIGLCDTVTIEKAESPGIRLEVCLSPELSGEHIPCGKDNLAYQAADLLMREFSLDQGVSLLLEKRIPAAAGLAGGSSDAAAVLSGVNDLFHLGLSKEELMKRGLALGADVPYCILSGTALAEGIGEKLTPLKKAPQASVLLAKPPVDLSTAYVYNHLQMDERMRHPDIDREVRAIQKGDLYALAETMGNVLEEVSISLYPVIGKIKEEMRSLGALCAQMSGSGPSVFGLFDDKKKAARAYEAFLKDAPEETVFLTALA